MSIALCPVCFKLTQSSVTNTWELKSGEIKRRRKCHGCGKGFHTKEQIGREPTGINQEYSNFIKENDLYNKTRREEGSKIKEWRDSILKKDHYFCRLCLKDIHLAAHHIKNYKDNPDLRLERSNGITLCTSCHSKISGHEKEFEEILKIISSIQIHLPESTQHNA